MKNVLKKHTFFFVFSEILDGFRQSLLRSSGDKDDEEMGLLLRPRLPMVIKRSQTSALGSTVTLTCTHLTHVFFLHIRIEQNFHGRGHRMDRYLFAAKKSKAHLRPSYIRHKVIRQTRFSSTLIGLYRSEGALYRVCIILALILRHTGFFFSLVLRLCSGTMPPPPGLIRRSQGVECNALGIYLQGSSG